jgi:hypothetical protein
MKDEWTKKMERDNGDNPTRLRDTFAAAALTGWLASQQTVISEAEMATRAYRYADAMLRERERHHIPDAGNMVENTTNHDAVPEARDGGSTLGNPVPPATVTGNTHKPVAWARCYPNGGPMSVFLDRPPADAEPLYRSPTLTDAEREAIERAAFVSDQAGLEKSAATLRNLLERMK